MGTDPHRAPARPRGTEAAPVEVAPVRRGPIELRRTFSGTLEATAEFIEITPAGIRESHSHDVDRL